MNGLYCTVLYCTVLYWTGLDWTGLDWTGLIHSLHFFHIRTVRVLHCCLVGIRQVLLTILDTRLEVGAIALDNPRVLRELELRRG